MYYQWRRHDILRGHNAEEGDKGWHPTPRTNSHLPSSFVISRLKYREKKPKYKRWICSYMMVINLTLNYKYILFLRYIWDKKKKENKRWGYNIIYNRRRRSLKSRHDGAVVFVGGICRFVSSPENRLNPVYHPTRFSRFQPQPPRGYFKTAAALIRIYYEQVCITMMTRQIFDI